YVNDRENLRKHERREESLQHARKNQSVRRGRDAAENGRHGEARHPEHEHPFSSEPVAEPSPRNERRGVRERVARDDELDFRERRAERLSYRRDRNVHDVKIERDEKAPDEHDRERRPAARIGRDDVEYAGDGFIGHWNGHSTRTSTVIRKRAA